jgi:predicted NBD/HSP70 family sugar kinase
VYYHGEAQAIPADRTAMVFYWDLGLGFIFGRNGRLLVVGGGDEPGQLFSELGHIKVMDGGSRCRCGQTGCLEALAGGWVLLRRLAGRGGGTLEGLVQIVGAGDLSATRAVEDTCGLLGRHLAWPLQMLGVSEMRVTGPLAPVFVRGQRQFIEGLGSVLGSERAAGLKVGVNSDYQRSLLQGANMAARRAYLYPEEFDRISPVSATLQGRRLAGI